jgi:hypothetical protein
MQKLDFVKNLEIILDNLKSKEILFHFESGFSNPNQNYKYNEIVPLLFSSKSNYEKIKNEDGITRILEIYNCEQLYSSENLTYLTRSLPNSTAIAIFNNANNLELYNFHNTIVKTYMLSKELLLSDLLNETYEESLEEGVNIFQIIIDEESLETSKYIKILTSLTELIDTINRIHKDEISKSEIILLDSGSDTNLGIKTGIETAKSLFLIFKEVWDFATNHRQYRNEQNNKALIESLSIRSEILRKVEEGVISESEGIEYVHLIKTRTDDLIGMKVMPKLIVIENNKIENKKLLKEMQGIRLLSNGE